MLKRIDQKPSHGCNFVEQVSSVVYKAILERKVKLWDSPQKEIQIMPAALMEIEKNAALTFNELETVFIYEVWEQSRKEITTKTVGIAFTKYSYGDCWRC